MDVLGGRFEMQTLNMPDDYDGKVITTVIRREARVPTHKALLYVHGYNDYFFQSQLAQIFTIRVTIFMLSTFGNTDGR